MYQVVEAMSQFSFDFDDTCRYVAANHADAEVASLERDFDRTDRGRMAPRQAFAGREAELQHGSPA
jgi:predicted nucleic acid-binding protein